MPYSNYVRLGKESLGHMLKNDITEKEHGIKAKCATTENPQENSIS